MMFSPRAQRSIKRLNAFRPLTENDFSDFELVESVSEEGAIGCYENNQANVQENIYFSNEAIYYYAGQSWSRVSYFEIESLFPENQKDSASSVRMKCAGDRVVAFSVSGEQDGFRDYFTVYQFLHRIIGDIATQKENQNK